MRYAFLALRALSRLEWTSSNGVSEIPLAEGMFWYLEIEVDILLRIRASIITPFFWVFENHVISQCQGVCPPSFSSAEKSPGNEVERKSCTRLSLWAWATWWTIKLDFVEIGTLGVCKEFGYWVRQRVPVRASTTYRWVLDRYRCASTRVSSPRRVKRDGASNGLSMDCSTQGLQTGKFNWLAQE